MRFLANWVTSFSFCVHVENWLKIPSFPFPVLILRYRMGNFEDWTTILSILAIFLLRTRSNGHKCTFEIFTG